MGLVVVVSGMLVLIPLSRGISRMTIWHGLQKVGAAGGPSNICTSHNSFF